MSGRLRGEPKSARQRNIARAARQQAASAIDGRGFMADALSEQAGLCPAGPQPANAPRRGRCSCWKVVVLLLLLAAISWPAVKIAQRMGTGGNRSAGRPGRRLPRPPLRRLCGACAAFPGSPADNRVQAALTGPRITDAVLCEPPRAERTVRSAARRRQPSRTPD